MLSSRSRLFINVFALATVTSAAATAEMRWKPEEFVTVSGPASPTVAIALRRESSTLQMAVEMVSFVADGSDAQISLGLAVGKPVLLTSKDAKAVRGDSQVRYEFSVPLSALSKDLHGLRLGLAATWSGGPDGSDRQRERLHHGGGSAHDALSPDPQQWLPFDFDDYTMLVADRKNRIEIPLMQPMDGKATVVIEDQDGRRIRNLISGQPLAKGDQHIRWDGLDDHGTIVAPGSYRWRSLHHPGITPEYQMSFGNGDNTIEQFSGWGPNHTTLCEATSSGSWTLVASPMTEGGNAIVVLAADGTKVRGMNPPMGMGMAKIAPTIIGDTLYIANDGLGWGQHFDPKDAKAVARQTITLARFNLTNGNLIGYNNKHFTEIWAVDTGPGASDKNWQQPSLTGMAALGDRLYLANQRSETVLVLDPADGSRKDEMPLPKPGAIVAANGKLYAVSAGAVVTIDPATKKITTVIAAGKANPIALAVDSSGTIYLSDGTTNTIRVVSSAGKELRQLGKPGGEYTGPYIAERMVNPRGLTLAANGWLWVTEDCASPKRILAWDTKSGKVVCEKFGTPPYGGSSAGFDSADHTRRIGMGTQWRIDPLKKVAQPTHRLGTNVQGAMNYRYVRDHGVTYLIGYGGVTSIIKLNNDGTSSPVAVIASTHRFCFGYDWHPPQVFIDAFNAAYPDRNGKHGDKGPGFLWTDRNGDGQMQAEEFDFATVSDDFAGAYWGHSFDDLTMRLPARVGGKEVMLSLVPQSFTAADVPVYPRLNDACAAGVPIDINTNQVETTVDRFGNVICNTDPVMRAFSPAGKLLWTYPNRWSNVHGSHEAPLPEVGVIQGALFFLGTAPLDDTSDLFMMNGNHGRFFMLTSDGLYVDEMFNDVRMGASMGVNLIGGECFGGFFARSAKDKKYYLQAGSFRSYRLTGVDQITRDTGSITVTPAQIQAAERALTKRSVAIAESRTATVPFTTSTVTIDGDSNDWPEETTANWDRSGQFRVTVRSRWDAQNLYLFYDVEDGSPWVNNGKDWTLLFKTGDSIDLQLGSDDAANPLRTGPVPGDLRLLIAPFDGKDIAVLYRHRLPDAKDNSVTFTCPWRSETVDSVTRLDDAYIAVKRDGGRYRVEAQIPLARLGLAKPAGRTIKTDYGVIFGDPEGQMNMLRSYWSNQNTGLVNDVPGEIMLTPGAWGTATFTGAAP